MNKQELIEKYKTKYAEEPKDWRLPSVNASRQALYSNFINDLEKLDEPKKVVVPKFVADELEKLADKYLTLRDIYTGDVHWLNNGTVYLEGKELELANWLNKNETTFEYAWIHGYEVEKEQLYKVVIDHKYLVQLFSGRTDARLVEYEELTNWHDSAYKLTESVIKSIDERYWPFAVKVDGE
ncbi:DUF1642 domain-containing protein [Enterococcus faecalis]|uniref:DUF1642 domain-containing protein n=1 Tax=Enterococcus faecalis TaxID=1351 RepID=UPI002225017E|nr:DUF1642 domain-containing protein [Enterococcus faecalis]UYY36713.1 DUF1642 domain-containing protein [Enterococcus faecalis]UYY39530.1 DUF1642 domain-containing protein [Enterococcus faecalis]HCR3094700.1 DUF1642 domain-containing protein [Enterococcus faecalis]HCR3970713.1 DUF1642 domain-containing protein [Enterococcus faecalis]